MLKSFRYLIFLIAVFIFIFTIFGNAFFKFENHFEKLKYFTLFLNNANKANETNFTSITSTTLKQPEAIKYTNPHDFKLVLNPEYSICGAFLGQKITLITFVTISPHLFDQRSKIRLSWGNNKLNENFRLFFSLGLSRNKTVNEMIKKEFYLYRDIVQESFYDSYHNLTVKLMMSFKWINTYCSNTYFTLRINDDVVPNTFGILNYLNKMIENGNTKNKLMGYIHFSATVVRDPSSKFYVSFKDYANPKYDDYCGGSAYILSTELTKTFFDYSLNFYLPPFSVW